MLLLVPSLPFLGMSHPHHHHPISVIVTTIFHSVLCGSVNEIPTQRIIVIVVEIIVFTNIDVVIVMIHFATAVVSKFGGGGGDHGPHARSFRSS